MVEASTAERTRLVGGDEVAATAPGGRSAATRWFYAAATAVGMLGLLLLVTSESSASAAASTPPLQQRSQGGSRLPPPPPPIIADPASAAGARAASASGRLEQQPAPASSSSSGGVGRPLASPRRPPLRRVLLLVADYMARSDIEPYGPEDSEISTPRLRRMAAEGVRFTSFYTAAPICGPSRASLLSGRYPKHVGFEANLVRGDAGLSTSIRTLPRWFSDAGWATSLSGKWHLGYSAADSPNAHGFDDFFGFVDWNIGYYSHVTPGAELPPAGSTMSATDLVRNGAPAPTEGYTTDLFTDNAVDFINSHGDGPFFIEVAYNAALPPYTPPASSAAEGRRIEALRAGVDGTRADYVKVIERVDWSVGRLLDSLSEHAAIQGDCLTVFTCDHGGAEMGTIGDTADGPQLQQGFATLWEGGLTIPLLLHWPGVLTPAVVGPGARAGDGGAVVTTPAIMMDLTATLLELTGLNSASSSSSASASSSSGGADTVEIDGVSLLPEIDVALGATPADDAATETDEERVFFWRLDLPPSESWGSGARRAVRRGRWKYLWDGGFGYLFDLATDPAEHVNVYSRHDALARELEALSLSDW